MSTKPLCLGWRAARRDKEALSERARRAAKARWARYHDGLARRQGRHVKITIRDSHQPLIVIEATRTETDDGTWTRWRIKDSPRRPVGRHGLAQRLAAALM